jgi:hypothetical protein
MHKLLTDCEYHDEKNKFIVERMTDVQETGFEELRLEVLYIKRGLILMKRFLEGSRRALFHPFRATVALTKTHGNSFPNHQKPTLRRPTLVGSGTSNSACVARFVIVKKAISLKIVIKP